MVRRNVSESAHECSCLPESIGRSLIGPSCPDPPVNLGVHWREEPTYGVYPATTPTIRVDQPVREYEYLPDVMAFLWLTDHLAPSLHGRSSRHEAPIVSVPAPVGSSVGETVREHEYLPGLTLFSHLRIAHCRVQPQPVSPVAGP